MKMTLDSQDWFIQHNIGLDSALLFFIYIYLFALIKSVVFF